MIQHTIRRKIIAAKMMKEIRKEGVRLFTGTGSSASRDGVFSREQKRAADRASGLG